MYKAKVFTFVSVVALVLSGCLGVAPGSGDVVALTPTEAIRSSAVVTKTDPITEPSPYVAQLDSPVRGLSAQEVDDLLAGAGMGYARMAELNSHPGPRHVLDLQQELKLSRTQADAVEAIFAEMQAQAQQLGAQIVAQEQQLSATFAGGAIDKATLEGQVMALAGLYGELRVTHLAAHLQVKALLTTEQIAAYNEQRGYASGSEQPHAHHMHH